MTFTGYIFLVLTGNVSMRHVTLKLQELTLQILKMIMICFVVY